MKAVLLRGHGGFDRLEYREDVPAPTPAPGEVLIRIGAAGVNNTDINMRIGWYSKAVSDATDSPSVGAAAAADDGGWAGDAVGFPRIQGADACGRIVAAGAGVDPARIGERVLVDPILRSGAGALDETRYFGSDRDGGFAELTTVPAANARRIESTLSDAELASFPCSYGAAENMLTRARVAAGETVLVTGASGGVGSAAVQLARRRGAQVVAVASAAKAVAVASLGARKVLGRDADVVAELGPESVDAVIDVVGGPSFPRLLEVLKRGGRYAVAGAIAGPTVELDLRTLYLKDLRLLGCTILDPEVFGNLIAYIERGEIKPLVSATYPLREIVAAQKDFLSKAHAGKIVLTP
ncbi:MAG TPA: alcohol dehydrogenase family protein [Steroidobacteraceae bacterium]|nr:alcohol dehydrogenase family protein [Steroidobacteraceae bacterium]